MSKVNVKFLLSLSCVLFLAWLVNFQASVVSANGTIPQYPPSSPDFWFNGDSSGKTSVLLEWSEVTGADGYRIYQKQGEQFVLLADVDASTKSWYWEDLECGKRYEFVVNAYNDNGESTPAKLGQAHTWQCDCSDYKDKSNPIGFDQPMCRGQQFPIMAVCGALTEGDNEISSMFIPKGWKVTVYDVSPESGPLANWAETMWNLTSDFYWESDLSTNDSISFMCATAPLDNIVFLPMITR